MADPAIVVYGSANIAEIDTGTTGGAIDTSVRYVFDSASLANSPSGIVKTRSSSGSDTSQTVTIYGRVAGGHIENEALSLNGTNVITGSKSFIMIMKIVISGAHTGTIFVDDNTNTNIVEIESGVLQVRRPFYDVSSDASGGSTRNFYEKLFLKNVGDALDILNVLIKEVSDPNNQIAFAIEDSLNGTESVASRLNTAPTDITEAFSGSDKSTSEGYISFGDAVGCWLRLTLTAGQVADDVIYQMQVVGSTM